MYNQYMRRRLLLFLGIIILITAAVYLYPKKSFAPQHTIPAVTPRITVSLSPTITISFCTSGDLKPSITLGAGAGNIYGTITLKNTSAKQCQIVGGEFISATYDTNAVKNITVSHIGQTQAQPFVIAPNETIYSQVHYPNGPQCQSIGLTQTKVTFTYKISPTETVAFKNQNGDTQQVVQTCTSPTDMTKIDIWNMSTTPITP